MERAGGQARGYGKTCWSLQEKDAELEGDKYTLGASSWWEKRGAGGRKPTLEGVFHYSFPDISQQSGGRGGKQQGGEGEGGGKNEGGAHTGIELVFPFFCLLPGNKFGSCYFSLASLPAWKPLAPPL